MEKNKRKFHIKVVKQRVSCYVGEIIVEAYTSQEAKALAKDFKENGDLSSLDELLQYDCFEHRNYQGMGVEVEPSRIKKVKMSMVELDEQGYPIERPRFKPTAHYVDASTNEIL